MPGIIVPILLIADGLVCILGAVFAHDLGFDPDPVWGRTRLLLAGAGAILMLAPLPMSLHQRRGAQVPRSADGSENRKTIFVIGHLWALIFVIYAWFITYGTFTKWDHTSDYYAQLADAFNRNQLHLEVQPSEAILAMADPYDPSTRPAQEEAWDMSLYKGRYYLYWGPLPALLIAPAQRLPGVKVEDIVLDALFYTGLVVMNSMIILKLRKNHFPNISIWNAMACIALTALILPVLWALIPTTIYGTAIGAGHFFLMGGFYFVWSALERKPFPDGGRLFLGGLFWACSVGSRALNAPSIIFLAGLAALQVVGMFSKPINWGKFLQVIMFLFIPLFAGAAATAWYNWARFDSPFEFGMRYQLTFFNLDKNLGLMFGTDYLLPNLFVYLLQPFRVSPEFPFAIPIYTPDLFARHGLAFPGMFFAGRMTGLLFGAPFLLLSLVHLSRNGPAAPGKDPQDSYYAFVIRGLAGSFLVGFLGLAFFFFAQMRYLVDVISQITLLAILGYWRLISIKQESNSVSSKIQVVLANLLLVATICISLLLGVTSESSRMARHNPHLLEQIAACLTLQK